MQIKRKWISIWVLIVLSFFALKAPPSSAAFSFLGGVSQVGRADSPNQLNNTRAVLPTFGLEGTLGLWSVLEVGLFYDHSFLSQGSLSNFGMLGRVDFSPDGFFLDAKGGVAFGPGESGIGAGLGLGYRVNRYLSPRFGVRVIAGRTIHVIGDFGIMFSL